MDYYVLIIIIVFLLSKSVAAQSATVLEHGIEVLCIRFGYETEFQWCTLVYSQANPILMQSLQG